MPRTRRPRASRPLRRHCWIPPLPSTSATGHACRGVRAQYRVVDVDERARGAGTAHYEFAHRRFAGGVGNRLGEVRAAQELATDEAQWQAALAVRARAREVLGVLLGA